MITKEELLEEITLDDIKTILTELGAQHIETHTDRGELLTNTICHNISDGKMKLYYYIEDKFFHCYTSCSCNHSIFDLVMSNFAIKGIEMTFSDSFRWVLSILGKSHRAVKTKGFIHDVARRRDELDWLDSMESDRSIVVPMKEHSEYTFELFSRKPHPLFLRDNISKEAMKKFQISYYEQSNRIVIPHRHWKTGKLIGFKTRSLDFTDIDNGYKYIPLRIGKETYSYPTFQNLYGLFDNKEMIKRVGKVIVFESEKSVLQFESYFPNQNWSVAICGSNISKQQVNMLVDLGISEVCLCLDKEAESMNSREGKIYKEKLERLCSMFSPYVKVSMVWDDRSLIKLKDSPTDSGKQVFMDLFKKRKMVKTKER